MRRSILLSLSIVGLMVAPVLSHASTVTVPDDFPTLQAVMDTVSYGTIDTVIVRQGVLTDSLVGYNLPGLMVIGLGDSLSRPSIGPMVLNTHLEPPVTFVNFRFTGSIHNVAKSNLAFRDCRLEAGLSTIINGDPRTLSLVGCRITGRVIAQSDIGVTVLGCWFDRGTVMLLTDGILRVENSTFTGSGTGISDYTAIYASGDVSAVIRGNTIRGVGAAIDVYATSGGPFQIHGNVVEHCGTGISAGGRIQLTDNVVTDCAGDGIRVLDQDDNSHIIEGNVIARSGGHGVFVQVNGSIIIRHNTSFANTSSGYAFQLDELAGENQVTHNIAYRNGHHGLVSFGSLDPQLSCNDWFGNDSSAVAGMDPSRSTHCSVTSTTTASAWPRIRRCSMRRAAG